MDLLVVDDDLVSRTHIKRILRRSDSACHIVEAEDVNSALSLLEHTQFDAILVDYNLSQRGGIKLLRELRTDNIQNSSAIIMMSTSEEEKLAMECLQAGAQDFVVKSDITGFQLRRSIIGAKARFEMEKKLQESYLNVKQLAERDELTKLANRHLFDESLKLAIQNNKRKKYKVALILFDLDHFKYVNDTHGHDVGDQLLKKVVNRVPTCLRGEELFSRLGGDEFAIILSRLDHAKDAEKVALRILRVLEKPFYIGDATVNIGASIGISMYPDNGSNATDVFKSADIAMYKAKNLGRNQIVFFEKVMQKQFLSRYKLKNEMVIAIKQKQFELHYQPIYKNNGKSLYGFEALIRWVSNKKKIRPDEFIPIAEETRLIAPIGRWVIESAFQKISEWRSQTGKKLVISINLSPVQLLDENIVQHVLDMMDKFHVPASAIEFELTETALFDDSDNSLQTIKALSEIGCSIALDDFGTGFSSFSHLHQFPIDTVKIDKSLMPDENGDDFNLKLVKGLVAMLHFIDLDIVAEGIELKSQLKLCQSLNIQRLQGYFLSKPMSAEEVGSMKIMKKRKSRVLIEAVPQPART